jgi:CRP/FNR family transcriptional regulator
MDELMGTYKSWYYFVLETYRQRFEELLTLIDHTVFRSMDERLLFYLKKQQESMKSNELKLTHEQIAEDLGSSRVVISRLLKQMEKDGKVRLFRSHLELVNI